MNFCKNCDKLAAVETPHGSLTPDTDERQCYCEECLDKIRKKRRQQWLEKCGILNTYF